MAKKKKEIEEQEDFTQPPQLSDEESEIVEFVRKNYQVPDTVQTVHVTEDKQVFYNYNAASVHAKSNRLKIFSIKWV